MLLEKKLMIWLSQLFSRVDFNQEWWISQSQNLWFHKKSRFKLWVKRNQASILPSSTRLLKTNIMRLCFETQFLCKTKLMSMDIWTLLRTSQIYTNQSFQKYEIFPIQLFKENKDKAFLMITPLSLRRFMW